MVDDSYFLIFLDHRNFSQTKPTRSSPLLFPNLKQKSTIVIEEEALFFVPPLQRNMDSSKSSEAIVTIDVHTAKELLDSSNYHYLDVRTIEEFNKSHVENAINVTYMFKTPEGKLKNSEFLEQLSAVCSKDDQLIVGCNSGGRSFLACGDLLEAGYTKVKNMEGGHSAWVDKGFAGNEKPEEELKTVCKFRP